MFFFQSGSLIAHYVFGKGIYNDNCLYTFVSGKLQLITKMSIFEFLLLIIFVVVSFIAGLFIWTSVTRLFKKKSHHYIVPPEPTKDKLWHPIDFLEYEHYIFIKGYEIESVIAELELIIEADENINIIESDLEMTIHNEWILLKISDPSFGSYNNLVNYWTFIEEFENNDQVFGFCKHKSLPLNDFIVKSDIETSEDLIGAFRSHETFGVYLPNIGLSEKGNISTTRNCEVNFYNEESKFPSDLIMSKMIPFETIMKTYRHHWLNMKCEDKK